MAIRIMIYSIFGVLLLGLSLYLLPRSWSSIIAPWKFLVKGRGMLIDISSKTKGKPFSLLIPGNRLHLVSSREHWNDLNNASIIHLSSHAWSKEHFQPWHTFGYAWPDRREDEGMPVVRAIRTISNQFPQLKKRFVEIMNEELEDALKTNVQRDGTSKIPLWDTVKHFASRMNMHMMFGEEVANNPIFVDRELKYIDEVTLVSEAAKSFPAFMVPFLAYLIRGQNLNQKYARDTITSEIRRHRENKVFDPENEHKKPHSILEALVKNLPEESMINRIATDMNTTFVSSTTATPIITTQLLQDIYTHPQYLPTLRSEAENILSDPLPDMTKLPLLKAFLVESIRTHCFLSTVIHRVPLKPFTFHDGYTVPKGEIVEFYQYAAMHDPELYPNPAKFDPERYRGTGKSSTDMGAEWPFWGNSKFACPGRFHVTNVAKLIAVYFIIINFDCEFEEGEKLNFEFRDVSVPTSSAKLVMKRRSLSG